MQDNHKVKHEVSTWQSVDISLCVFNGLVCGVLSFNRILHILGGIAFFFVILPIIFRRLYHIDNPPKRPIRCIMFIIRIIFTILLIAGIIINYLYLKNIESPF